MLHKWVINPGSRFPLLPLPLPQAGKRGKKVSCWVLSPSFWQWLCSLLGHQDRSVGRKGWKAGGQRLGDFAARQALYYKPRRSLSLALARRPTGSGNQLLSRQTTQRPRVPALRASVLCRLLPGRLVPGGGEFRGHAHVPIAADNAQGPLLPALWTLSCHRGPGRGGQGTRQDS